jgi:GntR family transcriptional regulator
LAADFGTSPNIVRDALALLRDEGLVDRVPGAGTFVVSDKAVQGLDRLRGLAETFETGDARVVNRVLLAEVVPATPIVAERLELEPATPVVVLERIRYLDGAPLSLDASYLTADVGAALLELDLTGRDVFGLLEAELGLPLGSAAVSIEAVAADSTVAAPARGAFRFAIAVPGAADLHRLRQADRPRVRPLSRRPVLVVGTSESHSGHAESRRDFTE